MTLVPRVGMRRGQLGDETLKNTEGTISLFTSVAQQIDSQNRYVGIRIDRRRLDRPAAECWLQPPAVGAQRFESYLSRRITERDEDDLAAIVQTVLYPRRHDRKPTDLHIRIVTTFPHESRIRTADSKTKKAATLALFTACRTGRPGSALVLG